MDDRRVDRRRKMTPAEEEALRKQRRKQRELEMKKARKDAIYREEIRRKKRRNGEDPHVVIEIPARPEKSAPKPKNTAVKKKAPQGKPVPKQKKRRTKTTPDIIKAETNKRVRNMNPKDYDDGYYIDEVKVRKEQAKKQKKERQKKLKKPLSPRQRKIRRILGYVAICAVIIGIGITLSFTVLFKTEEIVIQGNELYEESTIVQLAEVSKGQNIFVATMFGNTDAVEDRLPYVKDAKISFQIPDKVIIKITHDEPYYALKCDGDVYLINKEGRILEKTDKAPKKLMTVTANALKKAEVGGYVSYKKSNITDAVQTISKCLQDNNYTGVTAIDVKKMSQISITYDDRILIKIGLPEDIDYKIRTAFTIINKKLDLNNTRKIEGVLNVSECNETKKSYFNEGKLNEEEVTVPTASTQETTEAESIRSTFVVAATENPNETTAVDPAETATEAVE